MTPFSTNTYELKYTFAPLISFTNEFIYYFAKVQLTNKGHNTEMNKFRIAGYQIVIVVKKSIFPKDQKQLLSFLL